MCYSIDLMYKGSTTYIHSLYMCTVRGIQYISTAYFNIFWLTGTHHGNKKLKQHVNRIQEQLFEQLFYNLSFECIYL